ncbi:type III polyketide synthase [Marinobacter zhanjiangensis]|uniref:Naringenin-chalcone synthase n=1 Tax=Marinobacter zhanjiangensis TaxID=578215 RepID=A0ABQ3ALP9_9GAMM|nr:type III polyketide synthase [Marinobacter zhanjiangensis]GGY61260.1 naringenin-chalcone synthase [Marinobacter zhanjiangensis]
MVTAYLNTIATAVPDFDVHQKFVDYCPQLIADKRDRVLFRRMASRAQIDHRYSFLEPHSDSQRLDTEGFYDEAGFPDTGKRMQWYERHAFTLARRALDQLDLAGTTHILVTSCTGFYAPGLDQQIVDHYGLDDDTERTMVGFMGCFAALNALKLARHIVRSENNARVLVLNLELCTLHLKSTGTLEEMLSFLIFADGCAAGIVTAEPAGIALQGFNTTVIPGSGELITWQIGNQGFDMHLSGQVPAAIARGLPDHLGDILDGLTRSDVIHWAIHPGGRSVLDGVRGGAQLSEEQLVSSRDVLRRFGNMSSATIMFVLQDILNRDPRSGPGCAMAFGPGLTVESMRFAL